MGRNYSDYIIKVINIIIVDQPNSRMNFRLFLEGTTLRLLFILYPDYELQLS